MRSFLQIKIYRGKFIAYAVFVVFIGLAIGVMTCAVLLDQWIDNHRSETASAFSRVENSLVFDADRIEAYMQRIYSNSGLVADVRYFLGNSAEGYLTRRLQDSQYNQPLVSFPEDISAFLSNDGQGDIVQISLHTGRHGNILRFDRNGNASYRFQVPDTDEAFRETIRKGFVYRKKLSDPNQIARQLGEFRFLVGSDRIFESVRSYRLDIAAAVSASGDVYLINGAKDNAEEWVRRAAADGRSHGYLKTGWLNRAFFVTAPSSGFDYKFVSMVDIGSLIRHKASVFLLVFLIVLTAMVSVLLLIVYNLRVDANFLRRIINTIGSVKRGDFTPVTHARYRRNEYGMISRELDDMMIKLGKHIRTEYLLKLKQQETEMKALQHQIHPHFLYNTLEVIRSSALQHQDEDTAEAVAALGALFREIVKNEDRITIGSELGLLQQYLKIMEFKYPEKFYYQYNVAKALHAVPTVKFWMQPLAENFFVHGFNREQEVNLLIVNGRDEGDRYRLEFIDNGTKIGEDRLTEIKRTLSREDNAPVDRIGLRNVYTRLSFFYGEGFSMDIRNNEEAGVTISVMIAKEAVSHV